MTYAAFVLLALLVACSPEPRSDAAAAGPNDPAMARAQHPAALLDELDSRRPVPLLPTMAKHQRESMRDHLQAVQEIVSALASDDFRSVERAAGRIAFSEQMGQMCTHMGAGAPGFSEQALAFHRTADGIVKAARAGDRAQVLSSLGATLQTCTSCHAQWKQQLVDEASWQRLTAAPPPGHRTAH